jgi:hypothetical protein
MINIDKPPSYTKLDMKKLEKISDTSSVLKHILKKYNYDPKKFKTFLEERKLKKELEYLYEIPLSEIPLRLSQTSMSGYLTFRMSIGK